MTSTRQALTQIQSKAQALADNSGTNNPASIRKQALQILDLASLALKKLPNTERKAATAPAQAQIALPLFDLAEEAEGNGSRDSIAQLATAVAVQERPEESEAAQASGPASEIISPAPGMVAHVDRDAQTIIVSIDHELYKPIEESPVLQEASVLALSGDTTAKIEAAYDGLPVLESPIPGNVLREIAKEAVDSALLSSWALPQEAPPATLPVNIIKGHPIDAQQPPLNPECLFCGGIVKLSQEPAADTNAIWSCDTSSEHVAIMSRTHPVMLWCPWGLKSWGSATATTIPGWARQLPDCEPHCPRCGELYTVSDYNREAPEQEWNCSHCFLAFRVYRSEMAGTRCMALDKAPGVEGAQWITCFIPDWVKASGDYQAKEPKQEASNIEILATVTGKGISDATEVLSAATHAICVPTPEAQATLSTLGITNTPTEASHTPKDIEDPEELIAQIKSYETEIQLMALKGQNPELEARARELDDLIDPLRKQLREYHMANIRGPVSAPNASDSEYLSENVVPVATLVDVPVTSNDDLSPASPWIETGACPVCSGDLALYRQLFPADGAHAEWVCLSSEWQHRLSPRLYDSSTHVLKNGTEYRDIPTSELPWLEKYRAMGNPGGPVGRRYICDQCYQPRLDVVPVMNGMHHCGDCREPGDEFPYQQVQQDLEKKRATQLQQLQQLQQNHQATEEGN